jgi:hypothetical protein
MELQTFIDDFEKLVKARLVIDNEIGLKWLKKDIEEYFNKKNIKITKNE